MVTQTRVEYGVEYNAELYDSSKREVLSVISLENAEGMANGYFARGGADPQIVARKVIVEDWEPYPECTCECFDCITAVLSRRSFPDNMMYPFVFCEVCGNKRCPKATNHNNECTGSNEPYQKGSRYGGLAD